MAPITMECTVATCTLGHKGAKWKTPGLEASTAVTLLLCHVNGNHHGAPAPAQGGNGEGSRLEKLRRPVLTTGCCHQDFGFFRDEWRRYAASSRTPDNTLLRDQLLQCAETNLRKTLQNTISADRMISITVEDLMVKIEKAAVVKQSDLLDKVKLMKAKQDCDEPIKTFLARLRGLANIRNLSTECPSETCTETVSYVNAKILLALVKSLVDEDTKGEILSKVEQMDLDTTFAFVDSRETGKRDPVQLCGGGQSGPGAVQVLEVWAGGTQWESSPCRKEVTLQSIQGHKLSNKFVQRKPALRAESATKNQN